MSDKTSKELVLDAFKGEINERVPIWFMRQAGRYLPEYMEIRKEKTFEERSQSPELAAEITLQPIKRYDLDAAIIFSDILIPFYGMDIGLEIVPQLGPVIENHIKNVDDIYRLKKTTSKNDFPYLPESIEIVREQIPDKALFGFSGAPFTLASYLIEGKSTSNALVTKSLAYEHPKDFHYLMNLITEIVIDQLECQIKAGADVIQVFDSWAGFLSPAQFEEWAAPYLKIIFSHFGKTPNIFYARGSNHLLPVANTLGSKGISIDTTTTYTYARKIVGKEKLLQGNLDNSTLLTTPKIVEHHVNTLLAEVQQDGNPRYIFNLGQGIDRYSSLENVGKMVSLVKSFRR
ncbi:MAG: uroporphyrinogen decarboxylase [Candidatus Heimdallarchaeota archaeon]|nr:uroporphyrinogen decarboxylase [Candidatus Heimdallarchaeota archaeon]